MNCHCATFNVEFSKCCHEIFSALADTKMCMPGLSDLTDLSAVRKVNRTSIFQGPGKKRSNVLVLFSIRLYRCDVGDSPGCRTEEDGYTHTSRAVHNMGLYWFSQHSCYLKPHH